MLVDLTVLRPAGWPSYSSVPAQGFECARRHLGRERSRIRLVRISEGNGPSASAAHPRDPVEIGLSASQCSNVASLIEWALEALDRSEIDRARQALRMAAGVIAPVVARTTGGRPD